MEDLIAASDSGSVIRPRRLRRTPALRESIAETVLLPRHLVHPMFVRTGTNAVRPIASMPGHAQLTADRLGADADALAASGVPAVLLFGIPADKDPMGAGAWDPQGPVPRAIAELRRQHPALTIIADVCLCEYTSHGHCGIIDEQTGAVMNDATLSMLGDAAVTYANAGADIVAPSAMMDGQVDAIRRALDEAGHHDVAIMSYAVKYASAFYGPFREAAESAPSFGDRRAYQMDPANVREALREARLDEAQGADLLIVKPAGPYLDVLHAVRAATALPLAAYQVSGEYAMLKAAAERGWLDEKRAALESLIGIRRAGADLIITYYAREAAAWLREDR